MPKPKTKLVRYTDQTLGLVRVRFNKCHHCGEWFQTMRADALYCPQEKSPCRKRAMRAREKKS